MKPFADTIRECRNGALDGKLSEELRNLVREVTRTGRKGSLTLKLEITTNGDQIQITPTSTIKAPVETIGSAIFFTDAEGDLHRTDPRQKEMPFTPKTVAG